MLMAMCYLFLPSSAPIAIEVHSRVGAAQAGVAVLCSFAALDVLNGNNLHSPRQQQMSSSSISPQALSSESVPCGVSKTMISPNKVYYGLGSAARWQARHCARTSRLGLTGGNFTACTKTIEFALCLGTCVCA